MNDNTSYNEKNNSNPAKIVNTQQQLLAVALQQQLRNGGSIQGIEAINGGTKIILSGVNPSKSIQNNIMNSRGNNGAIASDSSRGQAFTTNGSRVMKIEDGVSPETNNSIYSKQTNANTITSSIVNLADLGKVKIPIPKIARTSNPPSRTTAKLTNATNQQQPQPLVLTTQQFAQLTQSGIFKVEPTVSSTSLGSSINTYSDSSSCQTPASTLGNASPSSIVIKTEPIMSPSPQFTSNSSNSIKSVQIPPTVSTTPSRNVQTNNGITLQAVAVNNSSVDVSFSQYIYR